MTDSKEGKALASSDKKAKKENLRKNGALVNETPVNAGKAFELLLNICGDYHLYQWKLTVITGFVGFYGAIQVLSGVFLAATPDYYCNIPYMKDSNITELKLAVNSTSPWIRGNEGNMEPSKCRYYDYNYDTNQSLQIENAYSVLSGIEEKNCKSWIYSKEIYQSTIVTEWDLVCGRKWLMSTSQSCYMLGMLLGSVIFSAISDKIGRRPSTLICCCLFIISSISLAFVNSFALFLILRIIIAGSGYGLGLVAYVILMEAVSLKGRNVMGNLSGIFFIGGFLAASPMAYYIRDWRNLQLAISVPSVILLTYFWILPESPRWLMMQGKEEEGIQILKSIAKTNKRPFPSDDELETYLKVIRKEVQNRENNTSIVDKMKSLFTMLAVLVRTPNMRKRNLIAFYTWFVASMTYYGLTFSGGSWNVSLYLSVTISVFVEIPAMFSQIFALLIFGRRPLFCFSFMLGGLSCLSIMFVPTKMAGLNLALSTIGKYAISMAFGIAYLMSAELVPTQVRNISLGMASMFARIGSGSAPYIVDLLGDVYYAIPFIIFGALALLAGILALMLPETGNKCLPESIEEIEAMPR